jgi:hypothetical protein
MADSPSLEALQEQILQNQATRAALVSTKSGLEDQIAGIDVDIAELDTIINDLQATVAASNPTPTLSQLSLTRLIYGGGAQALTVTGTGFVNGSTTILLNGSGVTTTVASATSASCTIPGGLSAALGTVTVQMSTTGPGGGTSVTLSLQVVNAEPVITTATPSPDDPIQSGSTGVTVTLAGTGFVPGSEIYLNGVLAEDYNYVSSTEMTLDVPDASIATGGVNIGIYVVNGTPGGGMSEVATLAVV